VRLRPSTDAHDASVHLAVARRSNSIVSRRYCSCRASCDQQFTERRGWYSTYYEESKSWVPAAFRNWAEVEDKAVTIRSWTPSFIDGLLQTADYARAQLETATGVTAEVVSARLTNRMQRQQRVLYRLDPPAAWFVVDELSLYRCVGSPEIMAAQMRHLAEVARMAHVVIQVLPAVAHPAGASSFMLADNSAYAEHVASGFVYTDGQKVTDMERLMATILSESEKASESLAMIERLGETWATGVSPLTAMRTAGSA
jgi:hypothetical protein